MRKCAFSFCIILPLSMLLSGCNSGSNTTEQVSQSGIESTQSSPVPQDPPLARVNGQPVLQSEIDQQIELALFELDWAKYESRRAALSTHVNLIIEQTAQENSRVEVLIEPPQPPRLEWSKLEHQPALGPQSAPIEISVFCNYQSSHCAGMQATYARLLESYPNQLRFVFYDYPLKFHRYAWGASQAARCADHSGNFQAFHKALWVDQGNLNRDAYLRVARQLGFDQTRFEACLDEEGVQETIGKNQSLAQDFGFKNVPVTLINGLYLSGPKDYHLLSYFVDQELDRLKLEASSDKSIKVAETMVQPNEIELPETALPLRLEGVIEGSDALSQTALILNTETNESDNYKVQDEVLAQVRIVEIHPDYVLLDRGGYKERLKLLAGERLAVAEAVPEDTLATPELDERLQKIEAAVIASNNVLDSDELPPEDIEYQYRGVVAPQGRRPCPDNGLKNSCSSNPLCRRISRRENWR